MKIKALSRSISAHQPAGSDVAKKPKNLDAAAHPFERAREYKRALNAVKMERMFAQPFICQLGQGHVDGVYQLAKDPNSLNILASGSGDGIVKVWDMEAREQKWQVNAHANLVKGLTWTRDQKLLTCGTDRKIHLFDPSNAGAAPLTTFTGTSAFSSLSHHRSKNAFAASSGSKIQIYDLERFAAAPEEYSWPNATDTINTIKFNQVEQSVLASAASDRSIVIWDVRLSTPVTKTVLTFASNGLSWNPMEAFNLAVANEDHNCYIFDVRKFDRALNVLKGHVAAVMDVEFSPTGEELATASYDRTIRIFNRDQGHSRDVYHTKRMQRVFATKWTSDSKYLISGSDDGNIRLWRANASKREGVKPTRQREAEEYNAKLVDRFQHIHIPTVVKKAENIKGEELKSIKRREENERKHTKKQFEKRKSEREKMILAREK
ncbi:Protein sof1 [Cytospora paraplurivora]|uniref:DDB1- and CUL4-associated factor 13 n=1 Tax=Cytospora paraplurivora TaxID=2898453 RepID=A0AAN9UK43_9PEZI